MPRRCGLLIWMVVSMLVLGSVAATSAAPPRLEVSSNGRFLVTANGKPFFWLGDTNWRLYKLWPSQIDTYLQNRKNKKFNVIQGPVLLHSEVSPETTNPYGHTNTDPTNPNQAWFNYIDQIVDKAGQKGMYIALVAVWGSDWHIFGSTQNQRTANAREYGKFLGNRYKNKTHVIWVVAGEYGIDGLDTNIKNVWKALAQGIKEGSNGQQLVTIHASYQTGRQSSSIAFHNANWLDFNMIQSSQSGNSGSGADNWNLVASDFNKNPRKPTIDSEANYERLGGWDDFGVRRRAYWSVFAGAFGHTYGANGVWGSYRHGDDAWGNPQHQWNQAVNYAGAKQMRWLRRLMESRPMLSRVPAQDMLLTPAGNVPNHIRATRDWYGRYAMVYVPQNNKTFAVNMEVINANSVRAWWYNPRNGKASWIGVFPASGGREFTTPANPNWSPDWVLVLDAASKNYPAPGKGGPLK